MKNKKKLCGFSFSINIANFEAFLSRIKLIKNLLFLKSVILSNNCPKSPQKYLPKICHMIFILQLQMIRDFATKKALLPDAQQQDLSHRFRFCPKDQMMIYIPYKNNNLNFAALLISTERPTKLPSLPNLDFLVGQAVQFLLVFLCKSIWLHTILYTA